MPRKEAALDAKQRSLAKRLIDFRQKLLQDQENHKPSRQVMQGMKGMDNALNILRGVARQLRRNDNALFNDVLDVVKSLQGDLSTKR